MLDGLINGIFNGISIGAVLLIVALGLAIVFGLMGVINLAHGELMMLGAYTTYVVQNGFKSLGDGAQDFYIFAALPLSFLVAALVGLALERSVIRLLYGRPLETLLATWGVSLILQQFVRSVSWAMIVGILAVCLLLFGGRAALNKFANLGPRQKLANFVVLVLSAGIGVTLGRSLNGNDALAKPWFSARNVDVTAPGWLQDSIRVTDTLSFPAARIFIIVLTIICLVGTFWFLNKSAWGLRIRSVTQNRDMSACLGIPTKRVDALTFALGSGLAGIAGCAVTLLGSVGPNLGSNYIVDAFMVVVVGGVGKLVGSIVAALLIGIVSYILGSGTLVLMLPSSEALQPLIDTATFFATTSMAKVLVFALIIAFLQVKPAGLFPQKGRSVEA
ncbi:urea ABC transporter permease subunit UrtB [Leptolyngbya cf. ectocarpi LEGE 11479]|uniref:Urea ABC transporter permease subunit UrtB n=1 Tax=Leptolyngbya cf. ectocarpi LEGE 11479 TaxID=1828722 RepID=A0A928ZPZ5_LEPEC|nr:urea ABC transporter permease subunit UrtB [Leptolyngbya ectocarpi]MBE9065725.1 urea ABC transporter permease subunit UrtB [Leptolyngbya cf. ectocarpi LEGE 11479]